MHEHLVEKVLSGGQTGADRAGLDAAIAAGIPTGGCCPKGRRAEDGEIPLSYPLTELSSADYRKRTERNVIDSDGTLVLNEGSLAGGTALTVKLCSRHRKPCLVVPLDMPADPLTSLRWIEANRVRVLNVAGPRESEHPGLHAKALAYLHVLFSLLGKHP